MKYLRLMLRNLGRNRLRTLLTLSATMVLVFAALVVWTVLWQLDRLVSRKLDRHQLVVKARWYTYSRMPPSYAATLSEGAARTRDDVRPTDSMTWQFYTGTLDPVHRAHDDVVYLIALDPRKIRSMMDDLDSLPPEVVRRMIAEKASILIGPQKLRAINRRVGDHITLTGLNYEGIDLELIIAGELPAREQYNSIALMNRDYLADALSQYARSHRGTEHPTVASGLNMVWLQLRDEEECRRVTAQIESSGLYTAPPLRCESAAADIIRQVRSYRELIWGVKWLLRPSILIVLSLVVGTAIAIGVRERRTEIAVLKVLGFRPRLILMLVLGEGGILGATGGLLGAAATFLAFNWGDLPLPRPPLPGFSIPISALWSGPLFGVSTALLGSIGPAWSACRTRVSEVFARVT